jgi:hypothetical protein
MKAGDSVHCPSRDIQEERLFVATILEHAYSTYEALEQGRGSVDGVGKDVIYRALQKEGLDDSTAAVCASLARDISWSSPTPLSSWLRKIRDFYYPKGVGLDRTNNENR